MLINGKKCIEQFICVILLYLKYEFPLEIFSECQSVIFGTSAFSQLAAIYSLQNME